MEISITLPQFVSYLSYMGASIVMMSVFIIAYLYLTPLKELTLIRQGCMAVALSFGGAVIGFCLTLGSSITHSNNILTFVIWGICSAIVQLLVYFVISHLVPNARMELEDNNIAMGCLFATISISIGIVNAACLS